MSTAYTVTGSLKIEALGNAAGAGDYQGGPGLREAVSILFAAAGGTAPTVSGMLEGVITAAAGDILLAHATDPLQSMGDAIYSPPGFTPAGTKLKLLIIRNKDAAQSITVKRRATNGLPIFDTASAGMILNPDAGGNGKGGILLFFDPTGSVTGALTSGSNDGLTLAISGGAPTAAITALYGP